MDNALFLDALRQAPQIRDGLGVADLAFLSCACQGADDAVRDSVAYRDAYMSDTWSLGSYGDAAHPPALAAAKRLCRGKAIYRGRRQPHCQGDLNAEHAYRYRRHPELAATIPPRVYVPPPTWADFLRESRTQIPIVAARSSPIIVLALAHFFLPQPSVCIAIVLCGLALGLHQFVGWMQRPAAGGG